MGSYGVEDGSVRVHVSEDKRGIALVLIPALTGWLLIVIVVAGQLAAPGSGQLFGMLFTALVVVGMAGLVMRDARTWGLDGGGMAVFVVLFFILGYPVYMNVRGKRGAPLGLGAGLCGLALMMLPIFILPLGASLLQKKMIESRAESAASVPFVMPVGSASASRVKVDPRSASHLDPDADVAVCDMVSCQVGTLGPNAKATLMLPANDHRRVEMDTPTPARLASLDNDPDITNLTVSHHATATAAITDLSPIAKLPKLEQLVLWNAENSDLVSLRPLVHLELLTISNTSRLTSLKGLDSLVNLKTLEFPVTRIDDLTLVGALPNLQELKMKFGSHVDLAPLTKLGSLRSLDLTFVSDTSMKPVGEIRSLRSLALSGTGHTDLDRLSNLTAIESLIVWSKVSAIPFVANMKALVHLDADDNPDLKDITPLKGHTALRSLELNGTGVTDLSPLATCTSLTTLSIRKTKAKDLSPLSTLKKLSVLNLAGIDGVDLMPLAKIPSLTTVTLYTGQVPDPALAAFRAAAPKVKLAFSKP